MNKPEQVRDGETLGPFEYTVSDEMADLHLAGIDNSEGLFKEIFADGRRVVPPCFTGRDYVYLFLQKGIWSSGGIQTEHESEFYHPLLVGQKVVCTGEVTERYVRKNRNYMVFEYRIADSDSTPLAKHRITVQIFSGKEPAIEKIDGD